MASEPTPERISTQRQQIDQFLEQIRFVYPLQFKSGNEAFPFYCGSTCFAAKYGVRLFIITAKHCIKGREGDPAIAGPDGTIFPLRQSFTPTCEENDSAWSDLLMFTTYEREHWPMLESAHAWDVDRHIEKHVWADALSLCCRLHAPIAERARLIGWNEGDGVVVHFTQKASPQRHREHRVFLSALRRVESSLI